jgi:hypothetical protein
MAHCRDISEIISQNETKIAIIERIIEQRALKVDNDIIIRELSGLNIPGVISYAFYTIDELKEEKKQLNQQLSADKETRKEEKKQLNQQLSALYETRRVREAGTNSSSILTLISYLISLFDRRCFLSKECFL